MNESSTLFQDPWTTDPGTTRPERHTLTPQTAATLASAHRQTGMGYRDVAAALGLDFSYWRRLCMGERAPSVQTAMRIIDHFDLDTETAEQILAESVVSKW